jgi:hypothetical protein
MAQASTGSTKNEVQRAKNEVRRAKSEEKEQKPGGHLLNLFSTFFQLFKLPQNLQKNWKLSIINHSPEF